MPDSLPLTSVRSSRRSGFSTRTCSWRTGTNRPPNPPPSPTTAKQVCAVSDETCLAFEFPLLTSTRWNYTDILTPQSDGLRWVQLQPEINHWQTNGAGVSFSYLWMAAGRLLEGLCFYRSAGEKLAESFVLVWHCESDGLFQHKRLKWIFYQRWKLKYEIWAIRRAEWRTLLHAKRSLSLCVCVYRVSQW